MKVGDTIVMFLQILPDTKRMFRVAVKGSVDKFHLRDIMIQKELELFVNDREIAQAHPLVNRWQAVAAAVGAASAGLIINNPVVKII